MVRPFASLMLLYLCCACSSHPAEQKKSDAPNVQSTPRIPDAVVSANPLTGDGSWTMVSARVPRHVMAAFARDPEGDGIRILVPAVVTGYAIFRGHLECPASVFVPASGMAAASDSALPSEAIGVHTLPDFSDIAKAACSAPRTPAVRLLSIAAKLRSGTDSAER